MSREVFYLTEKVANYIVDNGIDNVILLDNATRMFHIPLTHYFRKYYPGKRPKIYFLSPHPVWNEETFENQMREYHPHLFERRDKKTFVIDACIKTGHVMRKTKGILDKTGFSNVTYGALLDHGSYYADLVTLDFIIKADEVPRDKTCYPFHTNDPIDGENRYIVESGFIVSEKNPDLKFIGFADRRSLTQYIKTILFVKRDKTGNHNSSSKAYI